MKVLIGCEFSGRVRDAFLALGHEAISCDLLDTEVAGPHIRDDIRNLLHYGWDLLIAHPPCTYLCSSGARWWAERQQEQADAVNFVRQIFSAPIPQIAIENPIGILSTVMKKPNQIIHPWQFGHGETKATCLWLKNLPPLKPTNIVEGREARIHQMPYSMDRGKKRSITYEGIASAMAMQWGTSY